MFSFVQEVEQAKQNKPTLIVHDLEKLGINKNKVYEILTLRGVMKWLACRRDFIKKKNDWKDLITKIHADIIKAKKEKNYKKLNFLRGQLNALVMCREDIRKICHSTRLRAPDFDKNANAWLSNKLLDQ